MLSWFFICGLVFWLSSSVIVDVWLLCVVIISGVVLFGDVVLMYVLWLSSILMIVFWLLVVV